MPSLFLLDNEIHVKKHEYEPRQSEVMAKECHTQFYHASDKLGDTIDQFISSIADAANQRLDKQERQPPDSVFIE